MSSVCISAARGRQRKGAARDGGGGSESERWESEHTCTLARAGFSGTCGPLPRGLACACRLLHRQRHTAATRRHVGEERQESAGRVRRMVRFRKRKSFKVLHWVSLCHFFSRACPLPLPLPVMRFGPLFVLRPAATPQPPTSKPLDGTVWRCKQLSTASFLSVFVSHPPCAKENF